MYVPAYRHTADSAVNVTRLPKSVKATRRGSSGIETIDVAIKDAANRLLGEAIPSVSIVKDGSYAAEAFGDDPDNEADLAFLIRHRLASGRLSGFVIEGLVPYGAPTSELRAAMLREASFSGTPVVRVGRGYPEGFADPDPFMISGRNLTSTKPRLLLMACLMKFGSLPPAADPANPTPSEMKALKEARKAYQDVFDTH
jgi:L-asparaginase